MVDAQCFRDLAKDGYLGAGGDVEAGFDDAVVAKRNAHACVGTEQAALADAHAPQAAVGEQALRVLDTLRVDIAFIGTNAISVRHGLSTPDSEEAAVKRAMVRAANYAVVAADSSKVGREDFVSFAPISSVDTLITDPEISAADSAELSECGVEIIRAGGHP